MLWAANTKAPTHRAHHFWRPVASKTPAGTPKPTATSSAPAASSSV